MFRCMRQYLNGGPGPVVAAKTGNYFVGQGEFRGDFSGAPVGSKFFVAIGGHQQDYPSAEGNHWIHVALVDPAHVHAIPGRGAPVADHHAAVRNLPHANATLRMGRTVDGYTINDRETQFYGYVDDVAVFNRALTKQEIKAIINEADHRLHANQDHLVAAWIFDHTLPSGDPLPPHFSRPYKFNSNPDGKRASLGIVSDSRDDAFDAKLLRGMLPFQKVEWILPFDKGDVWVVVQGNGDPTSSHNGADANFAWDYTLASAPAAGKPPMSTDRHAASACTRLAAATCSTTGIRVEERRQPGAPIRSTATTGFTSSSPGTRSSPTCTP